MAASHDHDHDHADVPADVALRAKALSSLLVEKGLVAQETIDGIVETLEHRVGPHVGAALVARAWTDPGFKARLLVNGNEAAASMGVTGFRDGMRLVAVENTGQVHNVVVCTLCSCYPIPVLGLPPVWYKSAPFRSRVVMEPRGVLAEFGTSVTDNVEVRVWDSNSEVRYLVVPERPAGTEDFTEDRLATLVTRNAMIGVERAKSPAPLGAGVVGRRRSVNGAHDLGGMQGFGPVVAEPESQEPVFHADWERDVAGAAMATFRLGRWSLDEFRRNIESQAPVDYLTHTYYENWLTSISRLFVNHGIATPEELASGRASGAPLAPARTWTPSFEPPAQTPTYAEGDRVRAVNRHPRRHTRQPRYIRGRTGTVVRRVGAEPLPEEAAEGVCRPQHVYLVRFEAAELWGPDAGGRDAVYIELWESYLEPAA